VNKLLINRYWRRYTHILTSPGYAPGTIAVRVTWMKRGFHACQKASQHVPIYLQPFPSNSTRKFKSFPFSSFFSRHVTNIQTDGRTDGQTDTAYYFIKPAHYGSRNIITMTSFVFRMAGHLATSTTSHQFCKTINFSVVNIEIKSNQIANT